MAEVVWTRRALRYWVLSESCYWGIHRIVYRLKRRSVEILTIHHSARPLELSPEFEKF
jgi:membrane glycosyltransferase